MSDKNWPSLTVKKFIFPLLLVGCAFGGSALAQSPPPNIVIILVDDMGYGDVSYNGCPDFQTPNIDSIASNGILCTNGYVTHPFCSPSRAGLLTGRYQHRFGHEENVVDDDDNPRLGLPETEIMLPQILEPAGYVCGIVGKWHLGVASNFHPLQRGFDEFFGFLDGESNYYNANLLQGETPIVETSYLTDAFTREAVSFIDRHATESFFLYLAYNAPHTPYDQPPAIYMDRVRNITDPNRQKYAAMVTALDDGVGQVLQALQANNIVNNTLIFFLSDNGAPALRYYNSNTPFRGNKMNVLEGGIHIPFAVQWPARLPSPLVYQKPVSSLDIVPTAAAAAGVSLPTDRIYDGLNMIPYFAQEQVGPDRTLFWRWADLGSDGPPGSGVSGYNRRNLQNNAATVNAQTTEVFATNVDAAGTDLRWVRCVPLSGGPKWPAVLVIDGAGFQTGTAPVYVAQDLASAGFLAFAAEHRLAPPHTTMSNAGPPGDPQFDPPSDGRPPEQTDDVERAVRAARADPQCNGKVLAVAGSAGGDLTSWWGISGTAGDDKLDAWVVLSGPYDLDSADGLALSQFRGAIENYINHTTDEGTTFHDAAKAASSYWLTVSGTPPPCLMFSSQNDSVPVSIFNNMVTKMTNAGGIAESHLRAGYKHSFDYWYLDCGSGCSFSSVKDCSIDFLKRYRRGAGLGPHSAR